MPPGGSPLEFPSNLNISLPDSTAFLIIYLSGNIICFN